MSITRLPSGRLRVQVYDPSTGGNVSAASILGLPRDQATCATKREAKALREKARAALSDQRTNTITVQAWADRWMTDPLWQRPKASTNVTNHESVRRFVAAYGDLPLDGIGDQEVSTYLASGGRPYTVNALRAMFNDARSPAAGRLIDRNPFASLGLKRTRGNAAKQPPSTEQVEVMLVHAGRLVSPWWRAWLEVACFTGMRPGELDALTWDDLDLHGRRVHVRRQRSAHTGELTLPKNGQQRTILMPPRAYDALVRLPRQDEHCFVTLRGGPMSQSSRTYPWAKTRAAAGLEGFSLYLSTRHWAGWFMVNVLGMSSEDVALQLGHTDGGELVRRNYGHREVLRAMDTLERAYEAYDARAPDEVRRVA